MDKYTVRKIAFWSVIALIGLFCVAVWPHSSNTVVDLGNNKFKVPAGSELILNQRAGKGPITWHFTYNDGVVTIDWGLIGHDTIRLCGINCRREVSEWPYTFYMTQNTDGSVSIEYPWPFYET